MTCNRLLSTLVIILLPALAGAAPDLRQGRTFEGLTVYPDSQRDNRYYYSPGEVVLDSDADGRPSFHLLSTRFVGTAAAGTQGQRDQRNMLTFSVRLTRPDEQRLDEVRRALQSGAAIDLRPLPIRRMPTRLIYTPIESDQTHTLPPASLDHEPETQDGYWTERGYSLRLGARDAQLLTHALESGGVILSLSYAFIAEAVGMETGFDQLTGSPELLELIETEVDPTADDEIAERLVRADTTTIRIDTGRWPDLIRQIDINERLPPGFAVLDVRCYDFQHGERQALFEKRVDVRARTVAGTAIVKSLYFSRQQPERFAAQVRFPVAVHLDQPYEYRVVSTYADGRVQTETDWTTRASWTALLDVTATAATGHPDPAEPDFFTTASLSDLPVPEISQ